MNSYVLDASALLALLNQEQGSEQVASRLSAAVMCTVNLAEVVAKLTDVGIPGEAIHTAIDALGFTIIDFDANMAFEAASYDCRHVKQAYLLGDRACLATAFVLKRTALTADQVWTHLNLSITVQCIR
jgi:ribonuclease VapC